MRVGNTEKPRKKMDFGEVARASVRKQIGLARQEPPKPPEVANIKKVVYVGDGSCYYKQRFFFLGKYVRILRKSEYGGYFVAFCKDEDRDALNLSQGWRNKTEFFLDCAKFI